jgi:hypothetical protein
MKSYKIGHYCSMLSIIRVQNVSGHHPNVLGNTDWAKGRQAHKKIQQYFCWHLRHVAELIFPPYPNRCFPSSMRGLVGWRSPSSSSREKCGCTTFPRGLTRGLTRGWIEPTTTCKVVMSSSHRLSYWLDASSTFFFPFSNAFFGKKAWSCIFSTYSKNIEY